MDVETFIRDQLKKRLIKDKLEPNSAAIEIGIEQYRRGQASKKGGIFDDCYYYCKVAAMKAKK